MPHAGSTPATRPPRRLRIAPLAGLTLLALGCQSHERRPLDPAGELAAWLARTPASAEVRAFADGLGAKEPGSPGYNADDGITCAEAELIALVFNAELRIARLRAGVTRATAEHAGLWEDPSIGIDLTRVIEATPEPWKLFTSLSVTIPLSGRLDIEKQRAGAEHTAELERVAQREWTVRLALRRAWVDWSALNSRSASTRDFISLMDQSLTIVGRMEQAGEVSRTEARLLRVERATSATELADVEARAREAELRLRELMGLSDAAPLTLLAEGIAPAVHAQAPIDASEREAKARASPTVRVALAAYEAAESELQLEVRKQYPDLQVGPGYGLEDGQNQMLLGLSAPIPILNGNRQGIAQALARRELAHAEAQAALAQALMALHAAEMRLHAASRRRHTLESEIVPMVEAQYLDARRVVQLGEVNALVLLESLKRQQEAKLRVIEARRDEAIAAVDLVEHLGPAADGRASPSQSHDTGSTHRGATPPGATARDPR